MDAKTLQTLADGIRANPELAADRPLYDKLLGDQPGPDDFRLVWEAFRNPHFAVLLAGLRSIPPDDLRQLNRLAAQARVLPNFVDFGTFRDLVLSIRAAPAAARAAAPAAAQPPAKD